MEFWYRAGEEKERISTSMDLLVDSSSTTSSSTSSSYSYFTQQAIMAGIDIGSLGNDRPNMTKESLLEEIRKKRLREEMLVKEIARKRMLEEEILGELENGSKFENKDAWSGSKFERSSFVNQMINNDFPEVRFSGKSNELKEAESGNAVPTKFSKSELPRISLDRKFPASKLPGGKRKASNGLSDYVKTEWSCSLCHVTTSCENNLNVHINGKKHKAKEALLLRNKITSFKKSKALYSFDKDDDEPRNKGKDIKINEHAGEAHQERKNKQFSNNNINAWRRICKVDCNSSPMHQIRKVDCNSSPMHPIHQCWRNQEAQLEANVETLAKYNFEASKETFLAEDQDNVEVNEEIIDKINV